MYVMESCAIQVSIIIINYKVFSCVREFQYLSILRGHCGILETAKLKKKIA